MQTAFISLVSTKTGKPNPRTAPHESTLRKLGYTVSRTECGTHLAIQHAGFRQSIDLTDKEAAVHQLKEMVGKKELFQYTSSFKAINGQGEEGVYDGRAGANYVEWLVAGLSCLIAKPAYKKPNANREGAISLDAFLA